MWKRLTQTGNAKRRADKRLSTMTLFYQFDSQINYCFSNTDPIIKKSSRYCSEGNYTSATLKCVPDKHVSTYEYANRSIVTLEMVGNLYYLMCGEKCELNSSARLDEMQDVDNN
ncbi:hypothetical protein AYI70_g1428 [Smittium culicis]|uniref:Uncharacterized protein n=1 Tax=Smittium culicis TaxID=133412 RepID=A0A1R1YCN8_9FUNG|nr:hypothetical protein AYI70_g1428 [Smittium culicis]